MELHERVRKIMEDKCGTGRGSLSRFSKLAGLSKTTLTKLMNRDNDPQISTLMRLAISTGVDKVWLIIGEGENDLLHRALRNEMAERKKAEGELLRTKSELSKCVGDCKMWKSLYESVRK